MKQFVLFCLLSVPMTISAQTQYFLPTGNSSMDEKEFLVKNSKKRGKIISKPPMVRWMKLAPMLSRNMESTMLPINPNNSQNLAQN